MSKVSLALCLLLLVALNEVYEVQGTGFLLRHYLRKIPRKHRMIRRFALFGMMRFVNILELRSPRKPQFTSFFGNLRSYMNFINTAAGSTNFNSQLKQRAEGLHNSITSLTGNTGSTTDSTTLLDTLLSMGKTLNQESMTSTTSMVTSEQRQQLIISMARWAKTITQFIVTVVTKTGSSIDTSSLGIDVDVNSPQTPSPNVPTPTTSTPTVPTPTTSSPYVSTPTTSSPSLPTPTSSSPTGSGNVNTGQTTTNGGTTTTGETTTTGGTTATGETTTTGGTTATGETTTTGTGGTTNTGGTTTDGTGTHTTITKSCTKSVCNGGNNIKGSINYHQSGQSQQLHQSQQSHQSQLTATGSN